MGIGNSANGFKPRGALLECFIDFPRFSDDFEVLVAEGYVKVTSPETCEWTKSKVSLAEYFKWAGYDAGRDSAHLIHILSANGPKGRMIPRG
jgi:hypothetical protein